MNITYLASKKHPAIALQGTEIAQHRHGGDVWRGYRLAPGNSPQIRVRQATRFHPLQKRPATINWYLLAGKVEVAFERQDGSIWSSRTIESKGGFEPIFMPWALADSNPQGEYDLTIHAREPATIMCGVAPERDLVGARCIGSGIEVGPGSNPRIKNNDMTQVRYLEDIATAEEWKARYGRETVFDDGAFKNYIAGKAHEMPVDADSLDFIYSCHVFEHLANPLGHLVRWAVKLKPGGQVVTIVPNYNGTIDWLAMPSTVAEFLAEHAAGGFEPTYEHYRRCAEAYGRSKELEKWWASKTSIHVHTYDPANTTALLKLACELAGYREFYVVPRPNDKEFHWRLVK